MTEQHPVSARLQWAHLPDRPRVVCLCGSTRFIEQFFRSGWSETLEGRVVLSVGVCLDHPGDEEGGHVGEALGVKDMLDELHFRKIDIADDVLVLNVEGYVGQSTQREIAYAMATNKPVRFLDEEAGERFLEANAHAIGAQVASFVQGNIPVNPEDKNDGS